MKLTLYFLFFAIVLTTSCTPTKHIEELLNKSYSGKSFDDFVMKYGPPFNMYKLGSGDVIFSWSSGVDKFGIPSTTTFTNTGKGNYIASTSGGGDIDMECQIRILANINKIKSISISKDTVGVWNTSRCSEIFKDIK